MSALFRPTRATDFDRVYRRHAASVYRYVYAVLGNHADAEDVTQQTFIRAYGSISRGMRPRKAENWLLTIAHNEVRRHFRKTQGRPVEVELDERLEHPAPERPDPSVSDVLRALQQLPPAQRAALVMREFEGRSYKEMAQILGMTQGALEGLIFRARRGLAEQLEGAFTCVEAEGALLRRMDRRLPRREARRLKDHLRECRTCVHFATVQKRQRSLLKGLSILPIPASLHAFRGDPALATTGLAAGGAAGSAAIGVGGTAGTGIVCGVAAKAAAVAATAAVAGGVGYGVATAPEPIAKAAPSTAKKAAVAETRRGGRALEVHQALARGERPGRARPAEARTRRGKKAMTSPAHGRSRADTAVKPAKPLKEPKGRAHAPRRSAVSIKARAPKTHTPTRRRTRPQAEVEAKAQRQKDKKPAPARPARPAGKPKPATAADQNPPTEPGPPTDPPGHGPKR